MEVTAIKIQFHISHPQSFSIYRLNSSDNPWENTPHAWLPIAYFSDDCTGFFKMQPTLFSANTVPPVGFSMLLFSC